MAWPKEASTLCSRAKLIFPPDRKSRPRHQILVSGCRPQTLHFAPPNPCLPPTINSTHPQQEEELNSALTKNNDDDGHHDRSSPDQ
jgi:hypothetical protein